MLTLIGAFGRNANDFFSHVASLTNLLLSTLRWTFIEPFRQKTYSFREVAVQMDLVGWRSLPIVSIVIGLIGMILVLQTAYLVEPYGQLDMVPGGVAISLTREIGPLLTAIVMTGRVGAAYTAELGAMKTADEIMALEVMGINPVGYLISPRFLALLIMLPVLTVYGNVMGMCGGCIIGVTNYGIDAQVYFDQTIDFLRMKDLMSGMIKSFVFAGIISMVGCYKAFIVSGGGSGVGKATMEAVVTAIILIIVADAAFTAVLNTYLVD